MRARRVLVLAAVLALLAGGIAFGFCLDLERRFNDLFGLGFTIMHSNHDVDVSVTETLRITGDITDSVLLDITVSESVSAGGDMTPLLMGANFHFGPNDRVDLYGGPFVGRYMIAAAEPDEPDSDALDLDPLTVLFGLGYRF